MRFDIENWNHRAYAILRNHVGHTVTVDGWQRTLTEDSISPDEIAHCYGGFAVNCTTCHINLSCDYG
ncbi:hypothetical protein ABZ379_45495 [Streptomyces canus]|uniref:hypothetical protein n=1 Tax=Streptomyces canus TaxID=58343 RepID=UPI0033C6A2D6